MSRFDAAGRKLLRHVKRRCEGGLAPSSGPAIGKYERFPLSEIKETYGNSLWKEDFQRPLVFQSSLMRL